MATESTNKTRISKWDNAKCLLIFLVVLGHFADRYASDNVRVQGLFVAIYLFHMPAFFFVSGLFSKRTIQSGTVPWGKIAPYYFLSIVLNYYRVLTQRPWNPSLEFHLFRYNNVSWYLFTLFVLFLASFYLKRLHAAIALFLALCTSLLIGYIDGLGAWLALYRIGNFLFYFFLGYVVDPSKFKEFIEKRPVKALSGVIMAGFLIICYKYPRELYVYRKLITGANSYADTNVGAGMFAWTYRLVNIVLVLIIVTAFFSLVPSERIKLVTETGRRTLAIYFWHLGLVEIIVHNDVFKTFIAINNKQLLAGFIVSSAVIILILRCRVFSIPLDYSIKLIGNLAEKVRTDGR